ncbi:hypothetical protein ATANTOWER_024208 [Ataeniobius toweri]|uniref:Rab11-FIP3/4 domain-containing protein n=1 Tax=Ataeniobius toweri TaxID=208326 RepID=A0ABU7B9X8_9TELE|nr:hypothetical protein [Ataeniobius toweri]
MFCGFLVLQLANTRYIRPCHDPAVFSLEKQRMTDKLEDTSLRLKDEVDLYRKIMDKLWQNRHEFQKEKEAMQELIDDLRRELEHLQLFKLEMEHPGKGKGLSEYNAKNRETEMEHEVKRLKQII